VTFHKPGPGTTPVTVTTCKVVIDDGGTGWLDVADGAVDCADAPAQVISKTSVTGRMRIL
jgi:hypothetical protein